MTGLTTADSYFENALLSFSEESQPAPGDAGRTEPRQSWSGRTHERHVAVDRRGHALKDRSGRSNYEQNLTFRSRFLGRLPLSNLSWPNRERILQNIGYYVKI